MDSERFGDWARTRVAGSVASVGADCEDVPEVEAGAGEEARHWHFQFLLVPVGGSTLPDAPHFASESLIVGLDLTDAKALSSFETLAWRWLEKLLP